MHINLEKNQCSDGTKKPVLLCVSFGTSYHDTRRVTIDAIERNLQEAFPSYEVRRAFTSKIIIRKLAARDKLMIDTVSAAVEKMIAEGVTELLVQPTHVIAGFEYDDIIRDLQAYTEKFNRLNISSPLMKTNKDIKTLANILTTETKSSADAETAFVWMGHGTAHSVNTVYETLQHAFIETGHRNHVVGTVEAEPSFEKVLEQVKKTKATHIVLSPLMIVAGDHAVNDMASTDPDSWKSRFEKQGYTVTALLKGMGEYSAIRKMIVEHAHEALLND